MDVGEEPLPNTLLSAVGVINLNIRHIDINEEGRGVCEIAKPCVIGHHWENGTIVLKDGGLLELGVAEFNMDLVFTVDRTKRSSNGLIFGTHQGIRRGSTKTRGRGQRRARTA